MHKKHKMEGNKEKAILPPDYDDEDSSDEEEDEEIFDNSKVDWRVKGNLLRGKDFTVSENGNCPRCQSNVIVFVILDELFPMGDMPEILYNLLAKGKAVLWSSQDKHSCKKSPTFMCRGFCPPDPLGAGFNINWDTVNLTKLLKDLLKLNTAKAQKKLQEGDKERNEGENEDVNEKDIIKAMLAKEEEKEDTKEGEKEDTKEPLHGPLKEDETSKSTSSETVVTTSTTPVTSSTTPVTSATPAASYPVSKDGSCPHCQSTAVRYIILIKDSNKDITLPPTLDKLLKRGKAFKMAKGANNPPSFQCCSCTYGFNLDWSKTNLKKIFNLENETPSTSTSTTTASSSTAVSSTAYQTYTATSYPASSYQTSSSYTYTQPTSMAYPGPYGYPSPAPLMAQPMTMASPPPMGGMAPPLYGAPMPYLGPPQPYPGMPFQPYGPTPPPGPFMGPPLQNQFGPIPPGNMPPPMSTFQPPQTGAAPMYGMQPLMSNIPGPMPGPGPIMQGPGPIMQGPAPLMPGPGHMMQVPGPLMQGPSPLMQGPGPYTGNPVNFPGNMQGMPRLRVPKGHTPKGRNKNWKAKKKGQHGNHGNVAEQEQWSPVDGELHEDNDGEEDTNEDLYDPEAATRFEELLNKIDEHENDEEGNGDHEDEKPPGEETQAEFEVTAFTPDEKPAETVENTVKNISKPKSDVENIPTVKSEVKSEAIVGATTVTVNNTSTTEVIVTAPVTAKVSEPVSIPGNNTDESDPSVTSGVESGGLEVSPTPRTKAARGRKRQATGGRKKTARNAKIKKEAEDTVGSEDGKGTNNGFTGTEIEIKKEKTDDGLTEIEIKKEKTDDGLLQETADEIVEAPEDTTPKRVTRARSQKRKK